MTVLGEAEAVEAVEAMPIGIIPEANNAQFGVSVFHIPAAAVEEDVPKPVLPPIIVEHPKDDKEIIKE